VSTNEDAMNASAVKIAIQAMKSWGVLKDGNVTDEQAVAALTNLAKTVGQTPNELALRYATLYNDQLKKDKQSIDKPLASTLDAFNDAKNRWTAASGSLQNATEYAKTASANAGVLLQKKQKIN